MRMTFCLRPLLSLLLLPFIASAPLAAEWSFGIIPDTQWKLDTEAPFHGTAIHVIDAINDEMVRNKVDFVIAVGDLVDSSSQIAFETRAKHNKALSKAGIKFYPLRGNHDARGIESVKQFASVFPNLPGTAGNTGSSPDLPASAGMTYSFTHKGGKFILLDTFPLVDDSSKEGKAYTVADYLPWIDAELQNPDHRFAMIFAHKNLLGQNHKDTVFSDDKDNQDSFPETQNAFFACLQRHRVRYYFGGHDHMYHHSVVTSPDGLSQVEQIICGSAAHKFYEPEPPFSKREKQLAQELNRIGFLIVRVGDKNVKVEYYSTEPFGQTPHKSQWKMRDQFGHVIDSK